MGISDLLLENALLAINLLRKVDVRSVGGRNIKDRRGGGQKNGLQGASRGKSIFQWLIAPDAILRSGEHGDFSASCRDFGS